MKNRLPILLLILLGALALTACTQGAASMGLLTTPFVDLATTEVTPTRVPPTATSTPTSTPFIPPTATLTPTLTATPTATPPPPFGSEILHDGVEAVSYLQNECVYLVNRWSPDKAAPGTVVLPVMFHGISPVGPRTRSDNITISTAYFLSSMDKAHRLGFETITIPQLVDFLQHNTYIPPRSMLLIIDDRRLGTVREHFLPILKRYDWSLTMAYITGVMNETEWNQVRDVLATGYVQMEAHGSLHNGDTYITEFTSDEIIHQELFDPIIAFKQHLGFRPTAFIWPGGDFNLKSVQMAGEADYSVGFSAYARGPLLFNWIPQGELERSIGDPLLPLPRDWSTTLSRNLDFVVEVGKQAADQAERQRQAELDWYQVNCRDYPPLITPEPVGKE
jgi:hypothetical protein